MPNLIKRGKTLVVASPNPFSARVDESELRIKVVGRKGRPKVNLETAIGFLHLMKTLRGNRPFIPKGVGRFKTFEEADAWTLRRITGR